MPVSSRLQPSAAVISEREKSSVAYLRPAPTVARAAPRDRAAPEGAALPGAAKAVRTPAPAPGAPIVPATTQVAAASANNSRRPCRSKDVIVTPLSDGYRAEPKRTVPVPT